MIIRSIARLINRLLYRPIDHSTDSGSIDRANVVYTKEVAVVAAGRPRPLATDKGQSSGGTARNRGKVLRQQQSLSIAGKGIYWRHRLVVKSSGGSGGRHHRFAIPTAISRKELAASNAVARQNLTALRAKTAIKDFNGDLSKECCLDGYLP